MTCPELVDDKHLTDSVPRYEELFGENLLKQIQVAKIIQENFRLRKKKLKEKISFVLIENKYIYINIKMGKKPL